MSEGRGTRIYRSAWTILWVILAAVGGALNVAAHGWSVSIGIAIVAAFLCSGYYYNRPDRPGRKPHDGLAFIAGLGAIVAVSTAGWVTALGPGAVLLLPMALLSWLGTYSYLASRPRIQAWRDRLDPLSGESSPLGRPTASELGAAVTFPATSDSVTASPLEPVAPVSTMTDEQLCQAWRASFKTLEHLFVIADTVRQAQLITRRQQYLDELELRNPHGFARWLASGARPAGDPSRFI